MRIILPEQFLNKFHKILSELWPFASVGIFKLEQICCFDQFKELPDSVRFFPYLVIPFKNLEK